MPILMNKRRKLKVVKFPRAAVPDDTQFIETLVWVLNRARQGKIRGYAMVYQVEADDGTVDFIEAATAIDTQDRCHILGGIRRMEFNFMRRQWPED